MQTYNLFRRQNEEDLYCAVPEDVSVPPFAQAGLPAIVGRGVKPGYVEGSAPRTGTMPLTDCRRLLKRHCRLRGAREALVANGHRLPRLWRRQRCERAHADQVAR